MADYRGINPRLLSHKRVRQLSDLEFRIFITSIICQESCLAKGTGIFHVSTTDFDKVAPHSVVQDQLGRTDLEVALMLNKTLSELTEEDRKKGAGILTKNFSDLIEYEPESDMIFNKLSFEFSSVYYLKKPKAIVEAVHKDFVNFSKKCPERWWGEFTQINSRRLHDAFKEVSKEDKGFPSFSKTFTTLFELERSFRSSSPSPSISFETMEKIKKLSEELGKSQMEI